jgi:hypothetical protein
MGLFQSRPPAPSYVAVQAPYAAKPASGGWMSILVSIVGGFILVYIGLAFFNYIQKREGQPGVSFMDPAKSSGDKTPAPVDGKTKTVIPAGEIPIGAGIDYGIQYWMYISDWDYRFGQDKDILKRVASNNATIVGPRIFLAPTENTLHVRISLYPINQDAASADPGTSSTGDSFTCSVENVPLQSWFSVAVTVFQRNLDIYINGRLVKSCVLPGIPKPALGDVILADNGGFAGSICNVNGYGTMLQPENAKSFHAKGTNCAPPAAAGKVEVDEDSLLIRLFGYTFRFARLSKDGKELNSYTF